MKDETGREPTEPTDAELLRDVRALVRVAKEWSAQPAGSEREIKAQFPLYDTIARLPSDIADRLRIDPMPNRPAPDEVALGEHDHATHICPECHAGVVKPLFSARLIPELQAQRDRLRGEVVRLKDGLRDSRAETAAFGRQITRDKDEITALSARVAELEAVKRAADNMAYAALFVIGNQGNEANAIDGLEIARDKYMAVSAPGKEPTDA